METGQKTFSIGQAEIAEYTKKRKSSKDRKTHASRKQCFKLMPAENGVSKNREHSSKESNETPALV